MSKTRASGAAPAEPVGIVEGQHQRHCVGPAFLLENRSHSMLPKLRRILPLLAHEPILSGERLSGKAGAIHFKTLKYHRDYPDRFGSIEDAREWCRAFLAWYNTQHYHSGIGYLRSADLHEGRHRDILEKRQAVLDEAQAAYAERFHKRPTAATPPKKAWINGPTLQLVTMTGNQQLAHSGMHPNLPPPPSPHL